MAGFLHDAIFDSGLSTLTSATKTLHITSQQVTAFGDVATYTLGNKASPTIGSPADRSGGGREVTVSAISGGTVSGSGTATHYAVVDTANSKVLASNSLSASQSVTSGNTFSLASFAIGIPDPA